MKKLILLFTVLWNTSLYADVEIVLFDKMGVQGSHLYSQVQLLNKFYGIQSVDLPSGKDSAMFLHAHLKESQNTLIAVIINAEVLEQLDNKILLKVLQALAPDVLVLISGVRKNTSFSALQLWTGQTIQSVEDQKDFSGHYFIQKHPLAQQLAEQKVAWEHPDVSWLQLSDNAQYESIIQLEKDGEQPIFIKTQQQGLSVFVSSYIQPEPLRGEHIWRLNPRRFLQIAPLMLLIPSSCGEYCWYTPKHFANLTIDDPWLTEPYGLLRFQGLLEAMQAAKFHTTIGFIPWNYDRSETEAIDIFKQNPEHYSLCMHGNNHDHREFYKYQTNEDDPWPAKPLALHDFNLQQGLARLEKFSELTALNYDRVIVFPHNIAPEKTLALLKQYNFLATANGGNVPLGSPSPTNPLFYFRTVSTDFANFPSLDRTEPAEYTPIEIALDLYLGNPVLFFEHVLFFSEGLDAFNPTATYVNQLQPDIQWTGLGEIARHLYIQRKVSDTQYEVQAFSRQIKLYNPTAHEMDFTVLKTLLEDEEINQVTLNEKPQSFDYKKGEHFFSMSFTVPAGEQRLLNMNYANSLDLSTIELAKNDSAINRLRWLSDFRDITVSGTALGRAFTQWYYGSDAYKGGLKQLLIWAVLGFLVLIALLWWMIRYIRRARTKTA